MTASEKVVLTHGHLAMSFGPDAVKLPADAVPGAGYVGGVPRLGIPSLRETDSGLGVSYVMGARKDGATALPSAMAQAATWDPDLVYAGGALIGREARAKGFNVVLAGAANLVRDPRDGRTFEYLSEDPLLTGVLVGAQIRGIQSNQVLSTIKHFALNDQETGRRFADALISEGDARASDLLAFQIGIEQGRPGAVMCAYNSVLGQSACNSSWLLQSVLKESWGYSGFVMSDFGATPGVDAALHGLDQQSGAEFDGVTFFGGPLSELAKSSPEWAQRLDEMNTRILTSIYAAGLDQESAKMAATVDRDTDARIAQALAEAGIVLLRNRGALLPLAKQTTSIAVIGGHADRGVLSGAGSSQVHDEAGPAVIDAVMADVSLGGLISQQYHPSSPLAAIKSLAPNSRILVRDGHYVSEAVTAARRSQVAIVFATQWQSEGMDVPDLSLPDDQDRLIAEVAKANPRTIVVLETGGPVKMPWLHSVAAVLEAWYPGARGGNAIASVLFGDVDPGGRLPVTFPVDEGQLPRPKLDGADWLEPNVVGLPPFPAAKLPVDYSREGADVGYRWFQRTRRLPLFPFGFGLSYTSFRYGFLETDGRNARFTVTNTGTRPGSAVAQLYLVRRGSDRERRLLGFKRVVLSPGEMRSVTLSIDPRLLADWSKAGWRRPAGRYAMALGWNSQSLDRIACIELEGAVFPDRFNISSFNVAKPASNAGEESEVPGTVGDLKDARSHLPGKIQCLGE